MNKIGDIINFLKNYNGDEINIMEICGTHTAVISQNAISDLISNKINLVSGPGCPVCVTVTSYIDKLIELAMIPKTTVVTFGDILKVKGSKFSLSEARAYGAKVEIVYSPFDIIRKAMNNKTEKYVFAAVGFETTTPVYAYLLDNIIKNKLTNVSMLTTLKTMPPVINKLCNSDLNINGFIAPGNVSVVIGADVFKKIGSEFKMPFAIADFTAESILVSIYALVKLNGQGVVKNFYKNAVTDDGNLSAQNIVDKYFTAGDSSWRGLGMIENSGMYIREEYSKYDAGSYDLFNDEGIKNGCKCNDVVTGRISPNKCPLYGKICTPSNPQGACMVSTEGSCNLYFTSGRQ